VIPLFIIQDRGAARIAISHDEVRDMKAWHDNDEDRVARNWR
jgi:hypothetical protein